MNAMKKRLRRISIPTVEIASLTGLKSYTIRFLMSSSYSDLKMIPSQTPGNSKMIGWRM